MLCAPGGEIGQGGSLIEMCWRLIDVSAPVSGLFRTAGLITGFISHREKKSIVAERAGVYSSDTDINAVPRIYLIFVILSVRIKLNWRINPDCSVITCTSGVEFPWECSDSKQC